MKECRSSSALFRGAFFVKRLHSIRLNGLLCLLYSFSKIQHLWSYFHMLGTVPAGEVLQPCYLSRWAPSGELGLQMHPSGCITWAELFSHLLGEVSCAAALNPCFTCDFAMCPKASLCAWPWGIWMPGWSCFQWAVANGWAGAMKEQPATKWHRNNTCD